MQRTEKLRIGDLARATNTKVETIRYYELIGLLPAPFRTSGNFRAYAPEHLGRLSFIRRARDLGFTLDQVRTLLGLSDQKRHSCEAVDVIAREHLADVDRKIEDLKALRAELDSIINQCGRGTIADCRIIEALAPTHRARSDSPRAASGPSGAVQ
ncbi:MerR family transcriptional regulator [Afipia broomeae]|jgi:DNA-binding transcriptional MerR regulator|uniref:HTH merR-type domain-containing protein n=1 Tax=Afipia broomeae ATCC 49717 TaxID=883078 RepID=K8PAL3_9BRAD|nr:helix-turn-helix domain-containing protein [Afipia broomeae]EKS38591.1 hypothetical protein HMPREF9695_02431 [Afipia broomeae ATCC 49717]MCR6736015.1 helix-turn-helix domain-containing protein [Afipia sp.]